jgi:hypothetical protein
MALRVYIKLFVISAWTWGSWAFIKEHVQRPLIRSSPEEGNQYEPQPSYVGVFYSIWECLFFATLFLFIEKFVLQLIGKLNKKKEKKMMGGDTN